MKKTIIALVLISMPSFAAAMGCSSKHEQAMSCTEGSTWDQEVQACVPATTS